MDLICFVLRLIQKPIFVRSVSTPQKKTLDHEVGFPLGRVHLGPRMTFKGFPQEMVNVVPGAAPSENCSRHIPCLWSTGKTVFVGSRWE